MLSSGSGDVTTADSYNWAGGQWEGTETSVDMVGFGIALVPAADEPSEGSSSSSSSSVEEEAVVGGTPIRWARDGRFAFLPPP